MSYRYQNQWWLFVPALLVLALAALAQPAVLRAQTDERCFDETGYCISGRIREYWEQNGGLPVFGYPVTPQQPETIEGQTFEAQWFERNRLELHPENEPPYDVLLGRLGPELLRRNQGREWYEFPPDGPVGPQGRCRYVPDTEHNICHGFLITWMANGLEFDGQPGSSWEESLALFGLPLTGVITETLSDGNVYEVQYFERARFEYHPENEPPYEVLLGLLGNELRAAGQTPTQPPPPPEPVTASANPEALTVVGDMVYFAADDGIHGRELWRSDGTPEGTSLVRDIVPGPDGSFPTELTSVNGTLFFTAKAETIGSSDALWKSDGTREGTVWVADVEEVSEPWQLTAVGDRLFFVGYNDRSESQVWVSDGTPPGTQQLTATPGGIYPRQVMPMGYPNYGLTAAGDLLFFHGSMDDSTGSYALWRSDGTPEGTRPISTLIGGDLSPEYWNMTDLDGTLLFIARTGQAAYSLWRSDGTTAGTSPVQAFDRLEALPPMTRSYPTVSIVAVAGGRAYLLAGPTIAGPGGWWTSDGTQEGTFFVVDDPADAFATSGDDLYYLTRPGDGPVAELRRISDPHGEPQSIAPVSVQRGETRLDAMAMEAAGGDLYFVLNDPGFRLVDEPVWPAELWRSDGTLEDTAHIASVARSWDATDSPSELVEAGGLVYLVGDDGIHGRELWRTDGTPDGTWLVHDINTRAAP